MSTCSSLSVCLFLYRSWLVCSFGLLFQILRVVSLFGSNRCPSRLPRAPPHLASSRYVRLSSSRLPRCACIALPHTPRILLSLSPRSRRNSHLHGRLRCRIRRIDVPARQLRIGTSLPHVSSSSFLALLLRALALRGVVRCPGLHRLSAQSCSTHARRT